MSVLFRGPQNVFHVVVTSPLFHPSCLLSLVVCLSVCCGVCCIVQYDNRVRWYVR